jgi:hypothetical protein
VNGANLWIQSFGARKDTTGGTVAARTTNEVIES